MSQGQMFKYKQKDLTCITRNIHVKYKNFNNHYSNLINKVSIKKVGQSPKSRS